MDEIQNSLEILGALPVVVVFVFLWLTFGTLFRLRRSPKTEIQTLFHGNAKDNDQI